MNAQSPEMLVARWLASYKDANRDLLINDPEFAHWLDEEYVPIAGGWQY
jgi:hypothetical protein